MFNTLLLTLVLGLGVSTVAGAPYRVALLQGEGGCVFIVEEGYPPLRLELTDLAEEEKKVAGYPEIEIKRLEITLELLLDKVQFAMRNSSSTRNSKLWENPEKLLDKNFNMIFIPAVAAQLIKAGGNKKVEFFVGEKGFLIEGSLFLGIDGLHLKIDKIRGKLFRPEIKAEQEPFWKLIVKPPVKYYKTISGSTVGRDRYNWLYLPWKETSVAD